MPTRAPAAASAALSSLFASWWGQADYRWKLPVSSPYGPRFDPYFREPKFHNGIDIPVPFGTPVIAVFDGKIERIDRAGEGRGTYNGNAVFLKSAVIWTFCYLHLSRVDVQPGQEVKRGEVLGRVGQTGAATGPHLHFQVYLAGLLIDPMVLYPGHLFYRR